MSKPKSSTIRGPLTSGMLTLAGVALGARFSESLSEMQRLQWSPRDELLARNEAKLGILLNHAAENVPYYQDAYKRLGLESNELRTVSDLRSLPIFTKSDYRACDPELLFATNVPASLRIERKTSGSTGEPFQFSLIDGRCRSFSRAIFSTTLARLEAV